MNFYSHLFDHINYIIRGRHRKSKLIIHSSLRFIEKLEHCFPIFPLIEFNIKSSFYMIQNYYKKLNI